LCAIKIIPNNCLNEFATIGSNPLDLRTDVARIQSLMGENLSGRAKSKTRATRRPVLLAMGGCALASFAGVQPTNAADVVWNQTTGSHSYNLGTNWVGNAAPGAADVGLFNNEFTGTVTLSPSATVEQLSFQNLNIGSAPIAFDLGGNILTLGSSATTTLGRIVVALASTGKDWNTVSFTNGAIQYQGTQATVMGIAQAANADNNSLILTGVGTSLTNSTGNPYSLTPLYSGNSLIASGLGSDNNRFVVSNGAVYGVGNTLTVGSAVSGATNTGNVVEVTDATLLIPGGNRGIVLNRGANLTITNSKVLSPLLTSSIASSTVGVGGSIGTVNFNSGTLQVRTGTYNTGAGNAPLLDR
jgi:hypothetical protein